MDLDTFKNNFSTTVSRYEAYPAQDPHCYVVGFTVVYNTNGKGMYTDCQVPFSKNIHEYDNVVQEAWDDVYNNVRAWATQTMAVNPIINSVVVPTDF